MLAKAPSLGADELIVDLEDAVAGAAKDDARRMVVDVLGTEAWSDATVSVRVNAPRTPWCHADLVAVASGPAPPVAVVVPKVESAGDLAFVERLLDGVEIAAGWERPLRVQALIETAAGLSRVGEIAAAAGRRVAGFSGFRARAGSRGRAGGGSAGR
ncbi:MAG: aldolase/citrate lyase family protein, partial [Solirubrobacteraceae bacterium]|nr:aldolase/citrate lyase family protein [Solirubrobacteraceae bacterium]